MNVFSLIRLFLVVIVVLFIWNMWLSRGVGGGVVRASVPPTVHPQTGADCCLIPPNRGLK